jgi:cytoskeletal protein CcmA (bactofilin family)
VTEASCIVSSGIEIRGNVSGSGSLIVEGKVEGAISLEDDMTIAPNGTVVADLQIRDLTINGTMSGNVDASDRVKISPSAVVTGDIKAPRIVIDEGAHFQGSIEMDVPVPDNL